MKKQNKRHSLHLNANVTIFKRARDLRERETPSEKMLWEKLSKKQLLGYKFRRQHPFGRYILDFYCHKKKLVIELDGAYHNDKLQRWQDEERTKFLKEAGLKVIRFENKEVLQNIDTVIQAIANQLVEN